MRGPFWEVEVDGVWQPTGENAPILDDLERAYQRKAGMFEIPLPAQELRVYDFRSMTRQRRRNDGTNAGPPRNIRRRSLMTSNASREPGQGLAGAADVATGSRDQVAQHQHQHQQHRPNMIEVPPQGDGVRVQQLYQQQAPAIASSGSSGNINHNNVGTPQVRANNAPMNANAYGMQQNQQSPQPQVPQQPQPPTPNAVAGVAGIPKRAVEWHYQGVDGSWYPLSRHSTTRLENAFFGQSANVTWLEDERQFIVNSLKTRTTLTVDGRSMGLERCHGCTGDPLAMWQWMQTENEDRGTFQTYPRSTVNHIEHCHANRLLFAEIVNPNGCRCKITFDEFGGGMQIDEDSGTRTPVRRATAAELEETARTMGTGDDIVRWQFLTGNWKWHKFPFTAALTAEQAWRMWQAGGGGGAVNVNIPELSSSAPIKLLFDVMSLRDEWSGMELPARRVAPHGPGADIPAHALEDGPEEVAPLAQWWAEDNGQWRALPPGPLVEALEEAYLTRARVARYNDLGMEYEVDMENMMVKTPRLMKLQRRTGGPIAEPQIAPVVPIQSQPPQSPQPQPFQVQPRNQIPPMSPPQTPPLIPFGLPPPLLPAGLPPMPTPPSPAQFVFPGVAPIAPATPPPQSPPAAQVVPQPQGVPTPAPAPVAPQAKPAAAAVQKTPASPKPPAPGHAINRRQQMLMVSWFVQDDEGGWQEFAPGTSIAIEKEYKQDPQQTFTCRIGGVVGTINLREMTRETEGHKRKIMRSVLDTRTKHTVHRRTKKPEVSAPPKEGAVEDGWADMWTPEEESRRSSRLDEIVKDCMQKNAAYRDDSFPSNDKSFFGPHNKGDAGSVKHSWRRLPKCTLDGPSAWRFCNEAGGKEVFSAGDVKQRHLGTCWFVAMLSCVAEQRPDLLRRLLPKRKIEPSGVYEVAFYPEGVYTRVIIDDYVLAMDYNGCPTSERYKVYGTRGTNNQMWVPLMEKAYAKLHGSYRAIVGGVPADALSDLTGVPCETYQLEDKKLDKEKLWKTVSKMCNEGALFGASCGREGIPSKTFQQVGLEEGHAYSLLNAVEVATRRGTHRIVKLRNPKAEMEWKGDWSDSSPLWTPDLKEKFKILNADDGTFWMPWKDFLTYFFRLDICNIGARGSPTFVACQQYTLDSNSPHSLHPIQVSLRNPLQQALPPFDPKSCPLAFGAEVQVPCKSLLNVFCTQPPKRGRESSYFYSDMTAVVLKDGELIGRTILQTKQYAVASSGIEVEAGTYQICAASFISASSLRSAPRFVLRALISPLPGHRVTKSPRCRTLPQPLAVLRQGLHLAMDDGHELEWPPFVTFRSGEIAPKVHVLEYRSYAGRLVLVVNESNKAVKYTTDCTGSSGVASSRAGTVVGKSPVSGGKSGAGAAGLVAPHRVAHPPHPHVRPVQAPGGDWGGNNSGGYQNFANWGGQGFGAGAGASGGVGRWGGYPGSPDRKPVGGGGGAIGGSGVGRGGKQLRTEDIIPPMRRQLVLCVGSTPTGSWVDFKQHRMVDGSTPEMHEPSLRSNDLNAPIALY